MKNLSIILLILLGLNTQACSQHRHNGSGFSLFGSKTIKASTNYVTKAIKIDPFTTVNLAGSFDVIYTQQTGKPKLEVYTSDNIVELLDIYVKDGVLYLGFKKNTSVSYDKLEVRVSGEILNAINVAGSGRVELANGLNTGNLGIHIAGSGDVKGNDIVCTELSVSIAGSGDIESSKIRCNSLNASIAGSGDMKLMEITAASVSGAIAGSGTIVLGGKAEEANYSISGSGDLFSEELEAKRVSASISGSGEIKCHATEHLKVRVSGSGDVGYKGNPALDVPKKGLYRL